MLDPNVAIVFHVNITCIIGEYTQKKYKAF